MFKKKPTPPPDVPLSSDPVTAILQRHFGFVNSDHTVINEVAREINALMPKTAVLLDIQTGGGVNNFTFKRGNEVLTISTYSAMEDRTDHWRKTLLE